MAEVWISHNCAWPDEGGGDDGWFASEQAALDGIKGRYDHHYKVRWEHERDKWGEIVLRGHFKYVRGYSTEHTAVWEIRSQEIVG